MNIAPLDHRSPLGLPLKTCRSALFSNLWISLALILGGAGSLIAVPILLIALSSPGSFTPGAFKFSIPSVLIFVPLLAIGVYETIKRRGDRQTLYEHGLVAVQRGKSRAIAYTDIENIFQVQSDVYYNQNIAVPMATLFGGAIIGGMLTSGAASQGGGAGHLSLKMGKGNNMYAYQFELKDGSHVRSPFKTIGEHVKSVVFPAKLKQITQAYQQGETVNFGPLGLCPQGLTYRRKILPWLDFKSFEMGAFAAGEGTQKLYIKRHGNSIWSNLKNNWAVVELKDVPNFELFSSLVHHLQETSGQLRDDVQP